jgi:hypothetical protein
MTFHVLLARITIFQLSTNRIQYILSLLYIFLLLLKSGFHTHTHTHTHECMQLIKCRKILLHLLFHNNNFLSRSLPFFGSRATMNVQANNKTGMRSLSISHARKKMK